MFSKTILSLIASAMLFTGSVAAAEPVRIIFETDMGNDVDDVLALDMLYKYQDAGKIQLLLISNNKGNAYSAPFIHLMNDFYGWSGIPVASSPAELLPRQRRNSPATSKPSPPQASFLHLRRRHSIPWKNTGRSSRHNPTAAS